MNGGRFIWRTAIAGISWISFPNGPNDFGEKPSPEILRARLDLLQSYCWSSYRAYAGSEKAPTWLLTEPVLAFGGGPAQRRRRRYREYCECAVREGCIVKPWEALVGRLVLGGGEFIGQLWQSQVEAEPGAEVQSALARRPTFGQVIAVIEASQGQPWDAFRDRRGNWGRDLALYLGREMGGMKRVDLRQATAAGSLMAVSVALKRFGQRLEPDKRLRQALKQATEKLQNR